MFKNNILDIFVTVNILLKLTVKGLAIDDDKRKNRVYTFRQ